MLTWSKRNWRSLLLVLAGLSLLPAYLQAYTLSGPSDIPTVLLGDKVVVNSAAYWLKLPYSSVRLFRTGSPKRGDFVLLHILNNPRLRSRFFKRVMGLPGETIEVRENRVIVNGRTVPVRDLNPADFAWVPKAHPIGSKVQDENGHWITFSPGRVNTATVLRSGWEMTSILYWATIATIARTRVSLVRYQRISFLVK